MTQGTIYLQLGKKLDEKVPDRIYNLFRLVILY